MAKQQKRKASDEKEINGSSLSRDDEKKRMKKKKTRHEKGSGVEVVKMEGEEDDGGKDVAFARHQKRITDPRFSSLHTDPRFKPMSKRRSRMPVDSRFAAIFTDEKFASSAPVDKRGRPIKGSSESHPLRQYYRLSESEDDDGEVQREEEEEEEDNMEESMEENANTKKKPTEEKSEKKQKKQKQKQKPTEEKSERKKKKQKQTEEKEKKKKRQKEKIKVGTDTVNTEDTTLQLAPSSDGELDENGLDVEDGTNHEDEDFPTQLESRDSLISSEEEFLSSDDDVSDDIEDEPEEQVTMVEEATRRIAMVNMDWDQIKAVDLYVLMSSFLPESGQLVSVAIYPSEFGLKSMEEEAVHGPSGIFASDDDEDSEGNGAEIDEAKLRAYEKSKLRYYYAVVECDSSATADHLYKECDGVEFERTSNILDLRFIPDDMQFNHPPRDIATEAPSNYECKDFHTRALQQSKVQLSWDNDEPERIKSLRQKLSQKQLDEMEFKDFLASDDEESDDDDEDENEGNDGDLEVQSMSDKIDRKQKKRDKLLALLQSGDGSEDSKDDMDMEVTFNTDLEGISKRFLEREKNKDSESVWEAYLRKRREKRKARKRNGKSSSEDDSSDTNEEVADQDDDFFVDEELDADDNLDLAEKKRSSKKKSAVHKDGKNKISETKEQVASKEELELLLADDNATSTKVKGYNLKSKKKKGKRKDVLSDDELPEVDYNDPRLSALFTSPLYALDPTDPRYKRSAAYLRQVSRKQKGIVDEVPEEAKQPERKNVEKPDDEQEIKKEKVELMSLVKSLKRKVGSMPNSNK
ncbi:pre-rRNA-processing protein ESF1 [Nymphaea colorata]|nr:pre-rRNA-processing protein ESF1 [Nymphaea colorata]